MRLTRRMLLERAAKLALVVPPLGLGLVGCGNAQQCVDPDFLSTGEASLRDSLGFSERSPHGREKECSGCQFFVAGPAAGTDDCGSCRVLSGPVHPRGYCDSWSPRA